MKMQYHHFIYLTDSLNSTATKHQGWEAIVQQYEKGDFPNSERTKDLHLRLCWDMVRLAGLSPWICDNLYSYINDNHIETALKKIVPFPVKRF